MGSLRTPGVGETVASDEQPSGYRNAGEKVQNVGAQLWDGTGWVDMAGDTQPTGAHNAKARVLNAGQMLWESVKKEWIPASSGATKDAEADNEIQPIQNMLLNQAGTMDRQRNNIVNATALASEARTATTESPPQTNYNHSKLYVRLVVAAVGTGTLRLNVNSAQSIIASFAPFTPVVGSTAFLIAPGLANAVAATAFPAEGQPPVTRVETVNAFIAGQFTFTITPSDSSSWTYSVLYSLTV